MLVVDTDKARDFFEVLERLGPSDTTKIVRFINEVIRTLKATENRVKSKEMEIECLMKSLDELEENNEAEGSIHGRD